MTTFPLNRTAAQQSARLFTDPSLREVATILVDGVPQPRGQLNRGGDGLWPVFTANANVLYYADTGGHTVMIVPALNTSTVTTITGGTDDPESLVLLFGALAAMGLPIVYVSTAAVVIDSFDPTTLPILGGPMSIWGTGFDDATGVTFDGDAVTQFQVIADDHIACAVGPHAAGTVDVIVLSPRGDSDPADFTFV